MKRLLIGFVLFVGLLYLAAIARWMTLSPQQKAAFQRTERAATTGSVQVGDTLVVTMSGAVCGSTPAAMDEAMKWLVRNDSEEAARIVLKTGSSIVQRGDEIKVLDLGFMRSKVRLLKTYSECWVPTEVARSASDIPVWRGVTEH